MNNFDFLRALKDTSNRGSVKLTDSIEYDEYDVEMFNGATRTVYVPKKRSEIFEHAIDSVDLLTETTLRDIMRNCNAVTTI